MSSLRSLLLSLLPRRLPAHLPLFLLLVMPASTNYEMHNFGFGAGGVGVANSTNYAMNGTVGEIAGNRLSGTTYDLGPGLQFTQQSNTPAAPTLTNPSSYYHKLHFSLNTGNNPNDTVFAVAISPDNFVTTNYIQADQTIGPTAVYQTYAAWGGASGAEVIGLTTNTTYTIKTKAVQTKYTESGFSATATAATVAPSLSYDIDVSATDSETATPYVVTMGTLNIGTVTTATQKVWIDLDTNAAQGAAVSIYGISNGLTSSQASHTILSASGDLNSLSDGFGLQVSTATQTSGGPLTAVAPYAGGSNTVGIVDTIARTIFTSSGAPITAGRGSVYVKAKASPTTPAASDYTSIVTMMASAVF